MGQLGHGTSGSRSIPTLVEELWPAYPAFMLAAGHGTSMVLARDGTSPQAGGGQPFTWGACFGTVNLELPTRVHEFCGYGKLWSAGLPCMDV